MRQMHYGLQSVIGSCYIHPIMSSGTYLGDPTGRQRLLTCARLQKINTIVVLKVLIADKIPSSGRGAAGCAVAGRGTWQMLFLIFRTL